MKIAYLLGSLSRGGMETLLLDVFKNSEKAAFSFIGIHRKGGDLQSEFYKTKSPFFCLSPKFPFDPVYLYKLRKLLLNNNIDVVHAQQSVDAVYASIAVKGTSIKVVQTFHGYDMKYGLYAHFILKLSVKLVAINLFVSKMQQAYYQKKYSLKNDQCAVVYNGISFDKMDRYDRQSLRDELCIKDTTLLLGSVGNFIEGRDQLTICRFLNLLKKRYVDFLFLFVGNASNQVFYGKCVDYCRENNLDQNVIFLGSRTDVPNILHQLDAFIYASDHDSFGIAVVEAIAAGIPTFVNDWDVMKEVTEDGKYATLYKTKDINDLLNHFGTYMEQKKEYFDSAKKSAEEIRKKYSIETHLSHLYSVYNYIKQ